ncbi:hypothetical protein PO002_00560 [Cupriavidus necator]|uniref:hypothetical protein n=1 Tax=Cupriavidus necator TaxID=106590 RepID=UPI0039C45445
MTGCAAGGRAAGGREASPLTATVARLFLDTSRAGVSGGVGGGAAAWRGGFGPACWRQLANTLSRHVTDVQASRR